MPEPTQPKHWVRYWLDYSWYSGSGFNIYLKIRFVLFQFKFQINLIFRYCPMNNILSIEFSVSGGDQAEARCWHPVQGLGGLEYDQSAPGRWLHLPILGAVWRWNGGWVFHGLCKRWRLDTQSQGQFILIIRSVGVRWAGWARSIAHQDLVAVWRRNGGWGFHGLCKRWRLDTQSQGHFILSSRGVGARWAGWARSIAHPNLVAVWRWNGGWVFHGLCKRWRLETQSQGQYKYFSRGVGAGWTGWATLVWGPSQTTFTRGGR